ncbi:MAG: calcium/sodium antiporter [Pseudohongiellaceae bacterium]
MALDIVIIILGFVGLIWGADKFVFGASALARNLGISPMIIGLTIVAFGTSAPEIFSSAASVIEDEPALAIGNAVGSNIFNIGIVLGIAAIISPLKPPDTLFRKEIPALLFVTLVTGVLFANYHIGPLDALVLLLITLYFSITLFKRRLESSKNEEFTEDLKEIEENIAGMGKLRASAYLFLGLVLLILSAEALVQAATSVATSLGVTSTIMGLTVIALGTSLPELAATITSGLKGHHELAIGNIFGSNIINILAVLPFPGLFAPYTIEPELLTRDYATMLVMTLVLALFCFRAIKQQKMIGRTYGVIFILMYCGWFGLMLVQI